MATEKPPRGLRPKDIADIYRKEEIEEAVIRYITASFPIPLEWIFEYNSLADAIQRKKNENNKS